MYKINKQSILLQSGQKLFHTQDLEVLWGINNKNTLYVTINRFIKRKILFKIIKGLYSTVPVGEIDKYKLGALLIHKYAYLSCESVLFNEGVIFQVPTSITYVSSVSKKIKFGDIYYSYRKMKPERLFDFNDVIKKDGYFVANTQRAIADMKYFNPKYYFDNIQEDE